MNDHAFRSVINSILLTFFGIIIVSFIVVNLGSCVFVSHNGIVSDEFKVFAVKSSDHGKNSFYEYHLDFVPFAYCYLIEVRELDPFNGWVKIEHEEDCSDELPCTFSFIKGNQTLVIYPCANAIGRKMTVRFMIRRNDEFVLVHMIKVGPSEDLRRMSVN